jgi:hypothetical protein
MAVSYQAAFYNQKQPIGIQILFAQLAYTIRNAATSYGYARHCPGKRGIRIGCRPPCHGHVGGTDNGLPAVVLTLYNDHGQIGGTIGFYFQTRGEDGKWHTDGKPPFTVPLLSPKLDGSVLTFETIHHKRHGSPELGPNNRYRVTFIGPNEARLQVFRYGAPENDAQPGLKLIRRE